MMISFIFSVTSLYALNFGFELVRSSVIGVFIILISVYALGYSILFFLRNFIILGVKSLLLLKNYSTPHVKKYKTTFSQNKI